MNEEQHEGVRRYLARLLGWSDLAAIENALAAVWLAFEHRGELSLRGTLDLPRVALTLHRLMHRGDDAAPFVFWDPNRRSPKATLRSVESRTLLKEAIVAADGGTLCVGRRGEKFWECQDQLRGADLALVYFLELRDLDRTVRPGPVNIPALSERLGDVPRIIDECLEDCHGWMSGADRAWMTNLADLDVVRIETHISRVVALRASRTMDEAAGKLGIVPVALARWVERRPKPAIPWLQGAP